MQRSIFGLVRRTYSRGAVPAEFTPEAISGASEGAPSPYDACPKYMPPVVLEEEKTWWDKTADWDLANPEPHHPKPERPKNMYPNHIPVPVKEFTAEQLGQKTSASDVAKGMLNDVTKGMWVMPQPEKRRKR